MDPVSQGVLGGVAAQQFRHKTEKAAALVVGVLAGMVPDLDVLISSSTDPLLFLEYHRHFTHALVFIPIGALICAAAFCIAFKTWFGRSRIGFKQVYLWSFAGYSTHALLDACTTYGTQLLWPFSSIRVAWNNVSVVDPLFTLPLLVLLVMAVLRRSTWLARASLLYVFGYLGLGYVQQYRAAEVANELARQRGHAAVNLGVKPSFANIIVWKSVYEHDGHYFVDAIRAGLTKTYFEGVQVTKLDLDDHMSWLDKSSQQAKDIERFRWFSNNHLGLDPSNSLRIIDVRYSLVPNDVVGMWGVELDPDKTNSDHVVWSNNRPRGAEARFKAKQLWSMILGSGSSEFKR